uniref:Importin-4-like n=1 Tax=Phallusia mammillata TaxID=59560 RepID=A0A6F9DF91_9ASCI|nr:importin-4-like [Phallusia mammillata]
MDANSISEEMVKHLSQVLSNFQIPDTTAIEQATKQLRELSQHSMFVPALTFLLANDPSTQVRQLGAVVLRRKLNKSWKTLDYKTKINFRQTLLNQLTLEKDDNALRSAMQVVGCISKYELSSNDSWPEVMMFIQSGVQSANENDRKHALHLLSIICDISAEHLSAQYNPILNLLMEVLSTNLAQNAESAYYAVQAFNSLIPFLGDDQARFVRPLVPKSVQVVKLLLEVDESRAAELIEIFESLIETEVAFIAPYVKDLVLFSLQIAQNTDLEDETRVRALSLLQWVIKIKKKAILKHDLIGTILQTICPIIVGPFSDDDDDDESGLIGDSAETQTPLASCLQVIDDMALHLPPEKLYAKILPFVATCLSQGNDEHKRGLLLTLACLAEGTSEFIKNNHLNSFVETVCRGATDPHPKVRNAAMFAMGQFSEHLQPDISKYAPQVMPILFSLLEQLSGGGKDSGITRAYYALENFVEDLESGILPYLDQLTQHLLASLRSSNDIHSKELAVSAIGAVANAAKENIQPYLGEILQLLQECLSTMGGSKEEEGDEGQLNVLHTQALDTLGVLMRTVGKSNMQLAEDCLKLSMNLVTTDNSDPDLRRAAFGLFSALASIVGENMAPFLEVIVKNLVSSAQSTDGVIAHFSEDSDTPGQADFSFLDDSTETDLENGQDEDDDDADLVEAFSVENSYMDEKADACETLGDLAKYCPKSFAVYLCDCFNEVFKQIEFPHSDVRKSAIASCGQFTVTAYQEQNMNYASFLLQLFPLLCKTITDDPERLVVMTTIATTQELVSAAGVKTFANQEQDLQMLMNSLVQVLQQKAACQDDETDEEDEQQAEYDEMLVEYCGEIFPTLADKLGAAFLPYFISCLPTFLNKLKVTNTVAERSFGAGTIAEVVDKLGDGSSVQILSHIVPRLIPLTRDSEAEVRNNAIYGLGVVLKNGGSAAVEHYPSVLGCMSAALTREKNRRVTDNILGAVCRMIVANQEVVPLDQVLPVLLSKLPIVEDHAEDATVYGCLARLLRHPQIGSDVANVTRIVDIFAQVCANTEIENDVRTSVGRELREMGSRDMKAMNRICEALDKNTRGIIERIVSS